MSNFLILVMHALILYHLSFTHCRKHFFCVEMTSVSLNAQLAPNECWKDSICCSDGHDFLFSLVLLLHLKSSIVESFVFLTIENIENLNISCGLLPVISEL